MRRCLRFNDGYLHATETRREGKAKPPPINLASTDISEPARDIRTIITTLPGTTQDEATYRLLTHLSEMILKHGEVNRWQLKGREHILAELAVGPLLSLGIQEDGSFHSGDNWSEAEAGARMGVSKQAFNKSWAPKVAEVQTWVTRWARQVI